MKRCHTEQIKNKDDIMKYILTTLNDIFTAVVCTGYWLAWSSVKLLRSKQSSSVYLTFNFDSFSSYDKSIKGPFILKKSHTKNHKKSEKTGVRYQQNLSQHKKYTAIYTCKYFLFVSNIKMTSHFDGAEERKSKDM